MSHLLNWAGHLLFSNREKREVREAGVDWDEVVLLNKEMMAPIPDSVYDFVDEEIQEEVNQNPYESNEEYWRAIDFVTSALEYLERN